MGRRSQPEIKQRLLDACTDHALEHGLPDRLEPLAKAAGTSARMLIYHFGTRDGLLRAVLGHARQRQLDAFGALLRARPGEAYTTTLSTAWTSMAGPDGQPFLRMFGQWQETAVRPLWPDFRRAATTDWLEPLADGLRTIGREDHATLVLAVIRGLLMDLDATGDAARADRAFHQFVTTFPGTPAVNDGGYPGTPSGEARGDTMTSTPEPDLGSSTDQLPDDKPETAESPVDTPPTATTPAHGSSNAGINETRANRVDEPGGSSRDAG